MSVKPEELEGIPEADRPDLIIAAQLVDQIAPIIHGKPSRSQSIALAHLLSVWVCGFHMEPLGDPRVQQRFRERMLRDHIQLVRQLVQAEVQERAGSAKRTDGQ